MIYPSVANIGYALLLSTEELKKFHETVGASTTAEQIYDFLDDPYEYDPEEHLDSADAFGLEGLYFCYLQKNFQSLGIYGYGPDSYEPSGYAVFIESTHEFLKPGLFKIPENPTEDSLSALTRFRDEFASMGKIGWQLWGGQG